MSLSEMYKKIASSSGGGKRSFHRLREIDKGTLKDGDVRIRPVFDGDDILFANFHDFVPTKEQPEAFTGKKWPSMMGAVCGRDENYGHGACYVCDNGIKGKFGPMRPAAMTYFLVNVRTPILGEKGPLRGHVIGSESAMIDYPVGNDETKTLPELAIVRLPIRSIGPALFKSWEAHDTICAHDWVLSREGEGKETKYSIASDRPDESFYRLEDPETGEVSEVWNNAFSEVLDVLKPDLKGELKNRGSKEWYDRWFDPEGEVEWGGKKEGNENVPVPEYKSGQATDEQRAAVQAKLAGLGVNS